MAYEIQVIPIDILIGIIKNLYKEINKRVDGQDDVVCATMVDLITLTAWRQLMTSGTVDPNEDNFLLEIGFYSDNRDHINELNNLLIETNNLLSRCANQKDVPENPFLRSIHDTIVRILELRKVLKTATIEISIPNMLKLSEAFVSGRQFG